MDRKTWSVLQKPTTKKWVVVLKTETKGLPYYTDYGQFDNKKDAVQWLLNQSYSQ